ncbi:serine/threonine-protein kinase 32A isoform X5 [Trachemys scripta elegans]|uniref:serine/threonine-protein kinase 32A isoform X5 n=1 Tax=Trachemys scripta elegans TaxID=31138 RepID=UPI001555CC32|nr:serine/threonine-protein kinase 32A isoform X5 [Trachemys scripta elegans]
MQRESYGCFSKNLSGDSMFWKYSRRLLTKPLGGDTYSSLEFALSACILKADCSGVTYWGKRYIPVTGKELIFSKNRQDAVYLRSACSKGHYGAYCQKKCPTCLNHTVCNRLTGLCDGTVTCQERKKLELCEYRLTSKFCFASWKYWNGNCYYVPPYGVLNKSEAEFMCSRFQGAQLIKLNNTEEQRWIAKVITRKSWLGSLSYKLQSNSWIMPDGDRAAPRWGFKAVQDLCVQIEPVSGTFISFACSERASWICKGAPVPGALDSTYKWWTTLTSSLLVSVFVVVVSVFVTFKAARWRRQVLVEKTDGKEQRSKVEMDNLASWDKKALKSERSNPLN